MFRLYAMLLKTLNSTVPLLLVMTPVPCVPLFVSRRVVLLTEMLPLKVASLFAESSSGCTATVRLAAPLSGVVMRKSCAPVPVAMVALPMKTLPLGTLTGPVQVEAVLPTAVKKTEPFARST